MPTTLQLDRRRRTARRPAAAVVEAAFVLPLLLLFLLGIYEFGRLAMTCQLMDNAARAGGRTAAVHTADMTTSQVTQEVLGLLAGQDQQLQNTSVQLYMADSSGNNTGTWTDAAFGQYIAVQINATYIPAVPTFLGIKSTISLQSKAMVYSEAN